MTGATTWCVVYNSSEWAQVIDEEGKTVYPREFACARRSEVKDLLDSGYLVPVDINGINDGSSETAKLAKQEAQGLNDKIDAEKAKEVDKDEPAEAEAPTRSSRTTKNTKQ